MANVGVPPKTEFKPIPADIFEVVITDIREVPNTWYDPDKDAPSKKTQLEWDFSIRDNAEFAGAKLRYYTGSAIGRHPRNKLTNLVKIVDSRFDIDVAYDGWDDFVSRLVGRTLRVTTEQVERKDGEGTYAKVSGILPSKLPELSQADIVAIQLGGHDF